MNRQFTRLAAVTTTTRQVLERGELPDLTNALQERIASPLALQAWLLLVCLWPSQGVNGQTEIPSQKATQPISRVAAFPEHHANQHRYLKQALSHTDIEVRKQAIEQLNDLDREHRQIAISQMIEPLAEALNDPETREPAAVLLEDLGQFGIPAFVPLLEAEQDEARVRAAVGIVRILQGETITLPYKSAVAEYVAKAQQRAMKILLSVLANPKAKQWRPVAESAQFFPRAERYRAVALLLEALHQGPQREWAATTLAWMDSHGLPALIVAGTSDEEVVRTAAMKALSRYAGKEEPREDELLAVISVFEQGRIDPSREVSIEATRALARAKSVYAKLQKEQERQDDPQPAEARQLGRQALLKMMGIEANDPKAAIPQLAERVFAVEKANEEQRLLRHFAAQALASYGEPARSHLLKGLKHQDTYVRAMIIEAIGDQQPDFQEAIPLIIDALESEDTRIRNDASKAIARMNPTDKRSLERLEKLLDKNDRGVPVALARFGPVIAPPLLERIENRGDAGAEAAVRTFAQLEQPPSEEVIHRLIDLMGSENEQVLHRARRCLEGGWTYTRPYVLQALKEHQNPKVRQFAAQILRFGNLGHTWSRGPVVRSAPDVPHLLEALKNPDRNVRIGAAQSLAIVAPGVALWSPVMRKMIPELADALVDNQQVHGLQPIIPLEVLGDHAKEAISQVAKWLRTESNQAGMFLRERGEAAVPALREVLQSDDRNWRLKAIEVLREIGPPAKPATEELVPLAEEGHLDDRLLAARALAAIGAAPDVALATVEEVLNNRRNVRFWEDRVLDTLVVLVRDHRPAVPVLVPLLTESEIDREANQPVWHVDPAHLQILGPTGPNVPELIKALEQVALGHPHGGREAAFLALQQINPETALKIAPQYYRELAKQKAEEMQPRSLR